MSGGHSISSVSKHAQDAGCVAYGQVPHGAPNRNTHRKMGVFVCVHINKRDSNPTLTMFAPTPSASLSVFSTNRLTALRKKRRRAAASERMSGGHSISSVSKHAQDAGCVAYGQVPHGAPNKGTRTQCSICFCELLYFILCFQIVVIYNILILN